MRRPTIPLFTGLMILLLLVSCKNLLVNRKPTPQGMRALTATEQTIATHSSAFSVDLFKTVVADNSSGNVFISPLSLSMALAMTVNGAAGDTRDAMLKTLELSGLSMDSLNASYQSLMKLLENADPSVQMNLANAVWYRNTFNVLDTFKQTTKKYYDARVEGLDFSDPASADVINQWVSDQTDGKIDKMIQPPIDKSLVMFVMNAIYFKGNWEYPFDKKQTHAGPFTLSDGSTVSPDMMHMSEREFPEYSSGDVQMIDLPYGDSLFTMTVMLPPKGKDIDSFVAGLTRDKLDSWYKQLHLTRSTLTMPKFKVIYETGLKKVLSDMGMGVAFDPNNANFSNIDGNRDTFISSAKQKTYVNVDEEGTEAAAATSIGISITSIPPDFTIDRPFVYLIRERTSGTILFIGKMENPVGQ